MYPDERFSLEGDSKDISSNKTLSKPVDEIANKRNGYQLSFFQLDDPVLSQIKNENKG